MRTHEGTAVQNGEGTHEGTAVQSGAKASAKPVQGTAVQSGAGSMTDLVGTDAEVNAALRKYYPQYKAAIAEMPKGSYPVSISPIGGTLDLGPNAPTSVQGAWQKVQTAMANEYGTPMAERVHGLITDKFLREKAARDAKDLVDSAYGIGYSDPSESLRQAWMNEAFQQQASDEVRRGSLDYRAYVEKYLKPFVKNQLHLRGERGLDDYVDGLATDPYKANDWVDNPKNTKGQIADYMSATFREGQEKDRVQGKYEYDKAHAWKPESVSLIPGVEGYEWKPIPIGNGYGTIMHSEKKDPATGKMRDVWLTSDGNTFDTELEAASWQKQTNDYNAALQSARDVGAAPADGDVDKYGNVTLKGRQHMEETAVQSLENQRSAYVKSRYGNGYQYDPQPASMPFGAVDMLSGRSDSITRMYDKAIQLRQENVERLARQREGNADSFWQGVLDAVKDFNTWSFDLPALFQTIKVWDAYKVYKKGTGGSEGHAARALLSAIADSQDMAGAYKDGDIYNFGVNSVKSGQLAAEMGLTSGVTSSIRRTSQAIGRLAAKQVRNAAGKFFVRTLGTLSGDALSGLVVTNTFGAGSTLNDALRRYHGTLVRNDDGSYGFATFDRDGNRVHDGGESLLSSFIHAESTGLFNNMSEYGGESFIDPALKKLTGKMNLGALTNYVSKLSNNSVWQASKRLARKANIQSLPGEIMEEYYNNVLGLLNGDTKPEDFLKKDMHKQNILGTAATLAFMGALPLAGAVATEAGGKARRMAMPYRYRHLVRRVSDKGRAVLGDDWDGIRDTLDGTPSEDMESKVRELLGGKSAPQQKAVMDYATALTALRAHNVGRSLRDKALAGKGEEGETDRSDLSAAHQEAAYAQGRNLPDGMLGSVKPDYEAKRKDLSAKLGVSEDELEGMDDDALDGMMGRDDNLDHELYGC